MRRLLSWLAFASLAPASVFAVAFPPQREPAPPQAITTKPAISSSNIILREFQKRGEKLCRRYASAITIIETVVTSITSSINAGTNPIANPATSIAGAIPPPSLVVPTITVTETVPSTVTVQNSLITNTASVGAGGVTTKTTIIFANATASLTSGAPLIAALLPNIPASQYPELLKDFPQDVVSRYCNCKPLTTNTKAGIIVGSILGGILLVLLGLLAGRFPRKKIEIHSVCKSSHGVNESCPVWQKHPAFVAAEMMRQADMMEKPEPEFRSAAYQLFGTAAGKEDHSKRLSGVA